MGKEINLEFRVESGRGFSHDRGVVYVDWEVPWLRDTGRSVVVGIITDDGEANSIRLTWKEFKALVSWFEGMRALLESREQEKAR